MNVVNLRQNPKFLEQGISYIQSKWANDDSKDFYRDNIERSLIATSPIPIWYLLMDSDKVVGCCGLISADFVSCTDLTPWLCALYVSSDYRGNNYSKLLIDECKKSAKGIGYEKLYLTTDLVDFYEKQDFEYEFETYDLFGGKSSVYSIKL